MAKPSPDKLKEWAEKAGRKKAIVPHYFEVFPTRVIVICGECHTKFCRNLVPNIDEPVFVCPSEQCRARNWVPVYYDH